MYLEGLPDDGIGREVFINWKSYDINNKKTYYTDSNGLEMQQRILNYKQSYTFSAI